MSETDETVAFQRIFQYAIAVLSVIGGLVIVVAPVKTDVDHLKDDIKELKVEHRNHATSVGHPEMIREEALLKESTQHEFRSIKREIEMLRAKIAE